MDDIFNIPNSAFSDFYDKTIAIAGKRGSSSFSTTCKACILDQGYDDPLNDTASTSSTVRKISANVLRARDGWTMDFPPQTGDIITLESSVSFVVTKVNALPKDEFIMEARQK